MNKNILFIVLIGFLFLGAFFTIDSLVASQVDDFTWGNVKYCSNAEIYTNQRECFCEQELSKVGETAMFWIEAEEGFVCANTG